MKDEDYYSHENYRKRQKFFQLKRPFGSLQWKGTDVCMDIHCPCGAHSHLDTEFLYYFICNNCQTVYEVGSYIKLRKVSDEEKEYLLRDSHTFYTDTECTVHEPFEVNEWNYKEFDELQESLEKLIASDPDWAKAVLDEKDE